MKIKYTLTYEWEDSQADIADFLHKYLTITENVTLEEAIQYLKNMNKEEFAYRLNDRADNILPKGYTYNFNVEEIKNE